MKKSAYSFAAASLAALALFQSHNRVAAADLLTDGPSDTPNRFGISYRLGFNVSAKFKDLGTFRQLANPQTTPDGDPYNYDDGYVLVDASGNAGGVTRYWGYLGAPGQVPGNGTVVMHKSSGAGDGVSDADTHDPRSGVELTYNRELWRRGNWRFGVEGAFGWMNLCVHDANPVMAGVLRVSDAYQLPSDGEGGFISPPDAPYFGQKELSKNGNAVIDVPAVSSTTALDPNGAAVTGQRNLNANIFSIRLGPYVEAPITKRLSFILSGGLALVPISSDFSFSESVTIAGAGTQISSGSGSHSDLLVGGYVSGNLSYAITPKWDVFAGAQYMNVGNYTHSENGQRAELDFGSSIFVNLGVGFRF